MSGQKMPVLFIGHGSPMNVVSDNDYTKALAASAKKIPKPSAILVVSAHWLTQGTCVMCDDRPEQIYDFYGFPDELYAVRYGAKGSPKTAEAAASLLKKYSVTCGQWGLDHASWAVLTHMYPDADIPVIELSVDISKPPEYHFELGRALRPIREKGVLIMGSGNIVHNLGMIKRDTGAKPFEWAVQFDGMVKKALQKKDYKALIDYGGFGDAAAYSVPTPDHYFPMLYALGAAGEDEEIEFTHESMQNGSVSMRCFIIK